MNKRTIDTRDDVFGRVQAPENSNELLQQQQQQPGDNLPSQEEQPPLKIIRILDTLDKGVQVGTSTFAVSNDQVQEPYECEAIRTDAGVEHDTFSVAVQSQSMVNKDDVINNNTSYDQEDNISGGDLEDQLTQVDSPIESNNSPSSLQDVGDDQVAEELAQHNTSNDTVDNNEEASPPQANLSIACSSSQHDDQTDSQSSSSQSPRSVLKSTFGGGQCSKVKKKVRFLSVSVYYFGRLQGFTSVPSIGGSTLGMDKTHIRQREFSVDEFTWKRSRPQRRLKAERRRQKKLNREAGGSNGNSGGSSNSSESPEISPNDDSSSGSDISDCDFLIVPHTKCKLVPLHRRREILRGSGVTKISKIEHNECENIRLSREVCGCFCLGECVPEQCSCARAGIGCQVDRYGFPCHCSPSGCRNVNGRLEFNAERVKAHQRETLKLVNGEYQQQNSQLDQVSNESDEQTDTVDATASFEDCYLPTPQQQLEPTEVNEQQDLPSQPPDQDSVSVIDNDLQVFYLPDSSEIQADQLDNNEDVDANGQLAQQQEIVLDGQVVVGGGDNSLICLPSFVSIDGIGGANDLMSSNIQSQQQQLLLQQQPQTYVLTYPVGDQLVSSIYNNFHQDSILVNSLAPAVSTSTALIIYNPPIRPQDAGFSNIVSSAQDGGNYIVVSNNQAEEANTLMIEASQGDSMPSSSACSVASGPNREQQQPTNDNNVLVVSNTKDNDKILISNVLEELTDACVDASLKDAEDEDIDEEEDEDDDEDEEEDYDEHNVDKTVTTHTFYI